MVTVIWNNHLKYKINAKDHNPPHVHVEGGGATVRINLKTFEIMDAQTDFSERTVNKIIEKVKESQQELMAKWEEYYGKD